MRFEEVIYSCFIGDEKDIGIKIHLPSKWNCTESSQATRPETKTFNTIIIISSSSNNDGENGDGNEDESEC